MGKHRLKSINEIFSETWELYKSRMIHIVLVALLAPFLSCVVFVGGGIVAFSKLGGQSFLEQDLQEILLNPAAVGTGILLLLSATLLITWCHAALLTVTVQQERDSIRGLIRGWKYVFPLLWISSLYVGIIIAGLTFFILPGLLLALSMSLCFFIMVDENRTGIDALLASRLYIRGHWWNTLLKFFVIWTLVLLIGLIPLAGPYLSLLSIPFLLLYMVTVYRDLKEYAGDVEPSTSTGWLWVLFGVFGFLLPLLAFIGCTVALGPRLPEVITQVQTEINQKLGIDIFPQPLPDSKQSLDKKAIKPPTVRQLSSVDGLLIWRDPIENANSKLLDIKEVSVKGDQGKLILSVIITHPFSSFFSTLQPGDVAPLLSFYLDTDTNRATGGTPFGQQQGRTGYDLNIQIQLVVQQDNQIEVNLYQMNGEERRFVETLNVLTKVSGDTVTVHIPYRQLAVAPRDIIRICYWEAVQERGQGLAKDKLVPLK